MTSNFFSHIINFSEEEREGNRERERERETETETERKKERLKNISSYPLQILETSRLE